MGRVASKLSWFALAISAAGCLVQHDLFAREEPALPATVGPAPAPSPAPPRTAAPTDGALKNPYLAAPDEAARVAADATLGPPELAAGNDDASDDPEAPPPGAPLTAAEAAVRAAPATEPADEAPPARETIQPSGASQEGAPPTEGQQLVPLAALQTGGEPDAQVDQQTFEERLSPYGRWVETPEYGRVWIPNGTRADWRPYWDGRWALTEYGWTFVSADPWGWAAWHYGRWGFGVGLGWYWIPGFAWRPAWVNWRWGHGWACWSPWGFGWSWYSPAWVAIRSQHFTRPIVAHALPGHGATVARALAVTRPLPSVAQARPGAQVGPPVRAVERAVGHPVAVHQAAALGVHPTGAARPVTAAPHATAQPGNRAAPARPQVNNRQTQRPGASAGNQQTRQRAPNRSAQVVRPGQGGQRFVNRGGNRWSGGSRGGGWSGGSRGGGGWSGGARGGGWSGGHSGGGHSGGGHSGGGHSGGGHSGGGRR